MNATRELLEGGGGASCAIVQGDAQVSRGELRRRVEERVLEFRQAGIVAGDRVVLSADNTIESVIETLAVMAADAVLVAIPPNLPEARIAGIVDQVEARAFVGDAHGVAAECTSVAVTAKGALGRLDSVRDATPPPAAGLAMIQFTSGSTATARGVMVSSGQLVANARAIAVELGLAESDRALLTLPLHYCFGMSVLTSYLLSGGTVCLGESAVFADAVGESIARARATAFYGVPSSYRMLIDGEVLVRERVPSLRLCAQAGGKLGDEHIRALRDGNCAMELFVMYGQTEATARLSILPPSRLGDALGSVGMGLGDGTRIWVGDEAGHPIHEGVEGEVWAKGPAIGRGYWNDPEATASRFIDGRLRTGDRGVANAEGLVWIRGRKGDFIKVGGIRVAPSEIEDLLNSWPEITAAAVDGVDHRVLGQVVRAHIVVASGATLTARDVTTRCRAALQASSVPRVVKFSKALPMTASGKLDRGALASG